MRPHDIRPSASPSSSTAIGGLPTIPVAVPSTVSASVRPAVELLVTAPPDATSTRGDDAVPAAEISV